jgi:hypothetical protein
VSVSQAGKTNVSAVVVVVVVVVVVEINEFQI